MTRSIVSKFAALATGIALIFTGISAFTAVQSAQAANQTGYAGNVDLPDPTLVPNYLIGTEPVMAVLSDGSVVVGSKPHDWGVGQGMTKPLIKFNKDGSYDSTFDANYGDISYQGLNDGVVSAIAVDDQDNIYIGGTFITLNGDGAVNIAKLTPNGTPDTGPFYLAELDGFDRPVSSMVYADGYLTIGGQFNQYLSQPVDHVVRIDRDGNPDQIFDDNLLATAAAAGVQPGFDVPTLAVTPSGETVLMLNMNAQEPNGNNYQLLRVDASGNYDAAFGGNNGIIGAPTGIAVVNSGLDPLNHSTESYLISGAPRGYSGRMLSATESGFVKVSYDGIFDDPFTNTWSLSSSLLTGGTGFENIRSMAVQPNGRIIAIGATSTGDTYIFRLLPDGTVDQTWNPDNIFVKTGSVSSLELSPASDFVFVAGDFQDLFGNADPNFTRLSTAASFNVFLDPNDGVTLPPFPSFITDADGSFATPAGITRPGYTFDGWLDQPVGIMLTGPRYAPTYGGDITLTAQWTPTSQHVTYLSGGGSGTLPTQPDVATDGHFFVGANNLLRPGYSFGGWNDGTNTFAPLSDYAMGPNNVTFTAVWLPTSQHVTYADGGGAGAVPTQSDVATTATFTVASNTLNKPGFTFAGWSDGSATYQPGTTYTMGSSDVTLTALWSGTPHHVTYTNGGGSGVVPTQSDVATGAGFTVAANTLNLSGYHFGGWWDGTHLYQPGDTYIVGNSDVSLSAYFVQNIYHVVYAKGGGSGTVPTQSDVATSNTFIVAANPLNRAGYTFVGWSDGTVIYQPSDTYIVGSSDVTLTAVWSANQHHIVYLNGGGSGAVPTQGDVATDGTFPLAGNSLARPGYSFDGWFDGSNLYQPGDVYTVGAADVTLTARWTASPHHITYLNGNSSATGTAPTQGDVATDSAFVVAANPFNLAGFTFVGWSDGTATSQPGDTYFVGTQDVTLTATWILTVHHVTYDNAVPFGALPTQADVAPGHTFVVAPNSVLLPGFVFTGWTDGTSTYLAGDTYTMGNSDVTLTATYGGTPRHVTYLNGGGTGILPTQADVPSGSTFVLGPNNLSRPGYTFAGWWDLTVFLGTPLYQPGDIYTVGNSNVSLIAYWYPTLQHVTYLNGGGSGTVPTQADVPTDANFAVKANTLNRPGYTFAGWTDNGINLYQAADSITMGISDVTLTAVWNPTSQHVTYLDGGGSGAVPTQADVPTGNTFQLAPSSLSNPGFSFAGWSDGATTHQPGDVVFMGASDLTFTAVWSPTYQHVTYAVGGGAGPLPTQADVLTGDTFVVQANALLNPGFSFSGWSDGFATYLPGDTYTMGANDVTLTATWSQTVQHVTYLLGGGSGFVPTQPNVVTNGFFMVGNPSLMSRPGYTFAGWSDGSTVVNPGTVYGPVTQDVTFTAQWTANNLVVTYNSQGGSPVSNGSMTVGQTIASAPVSPVLAGSTFNGWFTAASGGSAISFPYAGSQTSDFTLYAQWTPVASNGGSGSSGPVTVTGIFDSQGGSSVDPVMFVSGQPVIALPNPVREGYAFAGWFTQPNAGDPVTPGYVFGLGDVTLYARWNPNTNPIVFDSLGGPTIPDGTYLTGQPVGKLPAPTRDGFIFLGWLTTDDKSTTVDETYRPSSLHGIKLKAQWLDRHNQFKVRHLVAFNGASSATSAKQLFKLTKFKSRLNGMTTIITQIQVWADKSVSQADAQAYAIAKGKAVGKLVTKSLKIKAKIVILPVLRSKGYQARHSWADVNVQFLK